MNKIKLVIPLFMMTVTAGCNINRVANNEVYRPSGVGIFLHAGLSGGSLADQVSIKWSYIFKVIDDESKIEKIEIKCGDISGAHASIGRPDLKIKKDGVIMLDGPSLPVTRQDTPWLFERSTTSVTCKAVISRTGMPEAVESAPVAFSGQVKQLTIIHLKEAYEFNHAR